MYCKKDWQQGFTLIEIMITVAIIGILAAIALPAYHNYTIKSANRACLYDAKAYANVTLYHLNDRQPLVPPSSNACINITNAASASMTLTNLPPIIANAALPGDALITCDMVGGAVCTYTSVSGN